MTTRRSMAIYRSLATFRSLVVMTLLVTLTQGGPRLGAQELAVPERMVPGASQETPTGQPSPTGASEPHPGHARVSAGQIPILEFLRYLQVASGLPVIYPSNDPLFTNTVRINILEDSALTVPLAKALLEAHGYEILSRELENGDQILGIQHDRSAKVFGHKVTPIYLAGADSAGVPTSPQPFTFALQKPLKSTRIETLLQKLNQTASTPVLGLDQVLPTDLAGLPTTVLLPGDDPLEDELLQGLLEAVGINAEPMILSNGSEVLLLSGRVMPTRDRVALLRLQHASPKAALTHVRAKLQANFVTGEQGEVGSFRYRAYEQQKALILKGGNPTIEVLHRLIREFDRAAAPPEPAPQPTPTSSE